MKTILLVEDNGNTVNGIRTGLENQGYETKRADSYLSAIGLWEKYKDRIKCIILDLNISPEGLSDEAASQYFLLSGIPFLTEIGWNGNTVFDKQIIIYSKYTEKFKDYCERKGLNYSGIAIFEKLGTSLAKLLDYIKQNV